jgi:Spy/CpxP family protein refolding chaperone
MKTPKLALLLLTSLLLGVCIGFFANDAILRARIKRYSQTPADMPQHITDRLTERLDLDENQRAQVLGVFRAYSARMDETREQSRALYDNLIEEVRVEIARYLTPEQQEEHKKHLAELNLRRQERKALMRAYPAATNQAPGK